MDLRCTYAFGNTVRLGKFQNECKYLVAVCIPLRHYILFEFYGTGIRY